MFIGKNDSCLSACLTSSKNKAIKKEMSGHASKKKKKKKEKKAIRQRYSMCYALKVTSHHTQTLKKMLFIADEFRQRT